MWNTSVGEWLSKTPAELFQSLHWKGKTELKQRLEKARNTPKPDTRGEGEVKPRAGGGRSVQFRTTPGESAHSPDYVFILLVDVCPGDPQDNVG